VGRRVNVCDKYLNSPSHLRRVERWPDSWWLIVTCPSDIDVAAALWSSFGVCFHMFSLFFFGDVGLQTRILGVFPGILQAMFSAFHVFGSATWLVAAAACRCDGALAGLGWNWTWEAESFFFFAFYNCTTMVFIFRFHASLVFVYRLPDLVQHFFTESVRQHAHWSFQASSCFRGNMSWCFLSKTDLEHQARLVLCKFYLPITTALSWSIFVLKSVAIRDVHNSIIVLYGLEMIFIFIIADDLSHFL